MQTKQSNNENKTMKVILLFGSIGLREITKNKRKNVQCLKLKSFQK